MNAETALKARLLLAFGARPGVRLFNNPVGDGWQGKVIAQDSATITLLHARRIVYGLAPNSSDIIGLRSVTVTSDMVGETLAVFVAPEVKTATGRVREGQTRFIAAVNAAGGRAGIVRCEADMADVLDGRAPSGARLV